VFRTCVIQIVLIAAKIWDETLDILLPQGINTWRNEVFAVEQITDLITKLEQLSLCITRSLELEQNSHKTKIVRHIKNYIFDNIRNKNLNTALIADSLGFSLNYIREIFKTVEKRSINEYIGLYRIELAKQLLIETEKNIYRICDEVGFSNYSYFCTYFISCLLELVTILYAFSQRRDGVFFVYIQAYNSSSLSCLWYYPFYRFPTQGFFL